MTGNLEGSCLCGQVRYTINQKPLAVYYCHCNDCKKSTGSAFHVGLVLEDSKITITSNTLNKFSKPADSGNIMTRFFCKECGSPLFIKDSAAKDIIIVKAGSLNNADTIQPSAELWTIHKTAWATINENIKSFEKGKALNLIK